VILDDLPPAFDGRAIPDTARESLWRAGDGHAIRRIDWTHEPGVAVRGSILFAPGRGDCYEKHLRVLDLWHGQGWNVSSLDWRGQGMSGRFGADRVTGHIDSFDGWIADLARFWDEWRASAPGPHVCIGHSMGGHIALRTVADGLIKPDALVLVAPMLGLNPGWIPSRALYPLGRLITALGDKRRPAWKVSELPMTLANARMQLLTHDEVAYADEGWWYDKRPDLVTGPPSWGWIVAAIASIRALERRSVLEAVALPVLILGTRADRLVSWRAIRRAAARLPRAELVGFGPESRHEILRETQAVRDRALDAVASFLERVAPQARHHG
jgi:lysophospholipase